MISDRGSIGSSPWTADTNETLNLCVGGQPAFFDSQLLFAAISEGLKRKEAEGKALGSE